MEPNKQHLELLYSGHEKWNKWRLENPEMKPEFVWAQLDGLDLSYYNFKDGDFNGASLYGTNFSYSNLENTNLQEVIADNAIFIGANLNDVQASNMQACEANFESAILTNWLTYDAKFYDSNFENANLSNSELSGCEFNTANLESANFEFCDLTHCNFTQANLQNAILRNCILVGCHFVDNILYGTDLSYSNIYGVSIWNVSTNENTIQNDLIITAEHEPEITLDNIKVAQFVYLLLNNSEIKDIIETVTSKVVLILGRFTPERKLKLNEIKEILRSHGYAPIIFDFEKPSNRTTQETITTIARLSKFIVADITDPKSIPQELLGIVQSMPSLQVIPIIEKPNEHWGMFDHFLKYEWVLPIAEYDNNIKEILLEQIQKIND
ncbi:pentapeptide repeat-containing protein [Flavobacterium undicola]|uniref:pentapeptide repeat-containing protein n=1 Tax=Flavobacterium undicola TaxID=1932779 RepID=UPI0013782786|nr:pentapeptide repeat-containing protein [Flavobacterium undicola]MBA0885069.1 pentapeptide repeat-containing protein [Flavobacterium undicola]